MPAPSAALPGVTVVIPTKDRRALLSRAVRSVLWQRDVTVELVVVDDGSTDGTADLLAGLSDERLVVLRNERPGGVGAARNRGADSATCAYVSFLDDDDVWAPDKLRAQLDALTAMPSAQWACTAAVSLRDDLRPFAQQVAPPPGDVLRSALRSNPVPGGASNALVRTDLLLDVGGFDPAFSTLADWELYLRLAARAQLAVDPRPLVGYAVHSGSMVHDTKRAQREQERLRSKHAVLFAEHDDAVEDADWLRYLGGLALRQGDRRQAVRLHAALARRGGSQAVSAAALAIVGGVWPGVQARRDRRSGRSLPAEWVTETERWLAPLRVPPDQLGSRASRSDLPTASGE